MGQMGAQENTSTIKSAFKQLLQDHQQAEYLVATKEELAEKAKNQQLLTKTSDYTVDNIVNGMASLQLSFGTIVNQLSEQLTTESDKLAELKTAIAVEKENLQYLRQVRLAADALHILQQEHQAKMRALAEETADKKEELEQEIAITRKEWQQEQEEFERAREEAAQLLQQQREQAEADYQYELERQRAMDNDDYEEDRRLQIRELAELGTEKTKDWQRREAYLADNLEQFTSNQEQIAGFESKLEEEYNKAKGNAIKDAERKAKVATDLVEKEWTATQQGYELKITSLQQIIDRQNEQITELTTQLQEVNSQAQNLALQAFQKQNN